jgi:putative redox protein
MSQVEAAVTLQDKMILTGKGHTPHTVQIDYLPPLGEDNGFMPTELLLTGLAACSGHTLLTLLRRMGKTISGMEVRAVGQRRDEHPTVFTSIALEFRLRGEDLDAACVERALALSEQKYCPVWAMLKPSVPITARYVL